MTPQELKNYLKAACDLEDAIRMCEEAIEKLSQRSIQLPDRPVEPQRSNYQSSYSTESPWSPFFGWGTAILIFIFCINDSGASGILGGIILAIICGPLAAWMTNKYYASQQRGNAQDRDYRDYQLAMGVYRTRLDAYEKAHRLYQSTQAAFEAEISRLRSKVRSLDLERSRLYGRGVLHHSCHNIVAVHQLYDYLDMGIATTLEGSNGLYALYQQDLRTSRICDNIQDLKRALETGFSRMASAMSSLSHAVRVTQSSINSLNSSLQSSLSSMQQSITAAQTATAAQMQSYMTQANSQLSRINSTLATASYNYYVTARESSARAYLRRVP